MTADINPVDDLIDLASERLGAVALFATDEFFAPKERLTHPGPPVWREGEYTDRGKWMDGWETRRRRDVLPGDSGFELAHDACVIKLGVAGVVRAVDVETTHFKGNFPESCSVDACVMPGATTHYDLERAVWHTLVDRTPLQGDSHNLLQIPSIHATHVRLNIFPDGGVARLRVYGDVTPDWNALRHRGEIDLAAAINGGKVIDCSDMFFGAKQNLIMPGPPRSMAEGWETKRRRGPGHDWIVVHLGAPGSIVRVEVDTRYFKGNAPAACSIDACTGPAPGDWQELLPRTVLTPDRRHSFDAALRRVSDVTHVRLNVFPDGGVARMHVFGRLA
ncbi:MAG TPA: allantoicase [Vicinamibacterales bacterium]|nr:allantoicase [Vicinamibacterales bacterium]